MNQKCSEQLGNALRSLFRNQSLYVARATEKGQSDSVVMDGEHLATHVEDADEPGTWHVSIVLLPQDIAARQPAPREPVFKRNRAALLITLICLHRAFTSLAGISHSRYRAMPASDTHS